MRKGTTPYHIFAIPVPKELVEELFVTYSESDETLFEKSLKDCVFVSANKFQVKLTQAETLKCSEFCSGMEVQVTLLTTSGDRLTSNIVPLEIGRVLKDTEI